MKNQLIVILLFFQLSALAGNEKNMTKLEYVEKWRSTAVQQMIQYKIPASITLAQAILESGNGNSTLAKKGNNHFGIKCHDWTGDKMYQDDDANDECFRVYKSAEESFVDHSKFLTEKKRYAKLFELKITDYKSWAKGLKDAGYATNPKYPQLLIDLIEDLKLNELDILGVPNNEIAPNLVVESTSKKITYTKHSVLKHENKDVKYIIAKKGDTFYKIAQEFGLTLNELRRFNDFDAHKDVLEEGDIVYVFPKRNFTKNKKLTLTESISVNELSQLEAMKVKKIMKLNNIDSPETVLQKGEKVILR